MTLVDNTYRYDGNANCIEKHTLSGLNRYTYDSLGQLVKAEYPTGTEAYSYDRAGNRLTRTTQNSREEYRHDAAGRLTGRSVYEMLKGVDIPTVEQNMVETKTYQYEYDRQGNTLSDGENTYRYDSLNRLVEIRTKSADIQKNHYDGEGLRAELEENGRLVSFIFDNEKAVCETDADWNTIRYIRGYELISSDSEKAKTYYHYASDELGSTTHVTDEAGKILNRYEYDAFGNFTVKEESVTNRFCFTGEQYDPASNLYYLRARFYSPVIGRFLNEDTYYGDGLNLYAYCHNNPVGYVDPSGHASYPYEYFPYMFDDIDVENGGKGRKKESDSTNLGKNIFQHVGINPNISGTGSHERQHLIPQQVYKKSQFLQDIGFNVDSHWNGIFDKNMNKGITTVNDIFKANNVSKELTDRYVSDKTHHGGGHILYNDAVEREVDNIQKYIKKYHEGLISDGMSTKKANRKALKEAQRQVYMLTEDLRTMNIDGIDLYKSHSSNSNKYNDADEYYEEFKKKKQEAHEKNWHKKY